MDVWVDPPALAELRALPGHMRQRIRRVVDDLAQEPRPPRSQALELPPDAAEICPSGVEVRRLSLASWRVVYAIDDEWQAVTVLAVRRRPPYQYDDLAQLIARL